jgi:hypothetical protein
MVKAVYWYPMGLGFESCCPQIFFYKNYYQKYRAVRLLNSRSLLWIGLLLECRLTKKVDNLNRPGSESYLKSILVLLYSISWQKHSKYKREKMLEFCWGTKNNVTSHNLQLPIAFFVPPGENCCLGN